MEYGTWQENRNGNLDCLQRSGDLTDVTILVDGTTFPAHRVILAAHSEYFHRMFTCGMAESRNQDVKLQGMERQVFQEVLGYIYCGRLDAVDIDILKGVYLAANMLQMSDLEHLTITKLGKSCSLTNCLDLYLFVESYCDLDLHKGIYKKVKRILHELLAEHWGEMISESNSATVSDSYTQLFQDGILPTPSQLTNRPSTSGQGKVQQDFLDLDISSLCEIFRLKSEQEEISDFSFSFGQTDLCEGLISWVSRDLEARQGHIHTLRQYICLHQVSGSTKKKYCKLIHQITNHHLIYDGQEEQSVMTYGQLEQDCIGLWCPNRRIPGLLLVHAWNPNDMNTLTSDHVKCHFVRPVQEREARDEMLRSDVLYSVREIGELSEGETHWLTNNNPVALPNGSAMMLTLDCGVVCGQVYHGLDSTTKCQHHSERFAHFCMSNISEDNVDLRSASICVSESGFIYIIGSSMVTNANQCSIRDDAGNQIPDSETCETFKLVSPPVSQPIRYDANSACLKGNLYQFGGTCVTEGPDFGYIWCSFDLQEFHTRYSQSYRAGHSMWKTKLISIAEEPAINACLYIHDLSTGAWMTFPDETPFRISGGATVWHLGKLYLIGGYTIEYDVELKSFYQNPTNTVWVFDPAKGFWNEGPSLPRTSLEHPGRIITFRGYTFGQAVSHAGCIYYSGGATLAINNIFKCCDTAPLNKYEYVSLPKVLRLEPNNDEWRTIFNPSPDHRQDYTLYGAVPASVSLKKIKVKNGRLVSCQITSEELGNVNI